MSFITIEINLEDTSQMINHLEKLYLRKNTRDMSLEIKRSIKFIFKKDFMIKTRTICTINHITNYLSIQGHPNVLDELVAEISIEGKSYRIFLPVIYYTLSNVTKVGRMVVYKRDTDDVNRSKYLVHRSNVDMYPLDHPGGHIEFLEFFDNRYDPSDVKNTLRSGKTYVLELINNALNHGMNHGIHHVPNTQSMNMDSNTIRWIFCGTCREVIEESGLDLYPYAQETDLIKIGTRTYYFSLMIPNDQRESGPMHRFKNEILTDDSDHESMHKILHNQIPRSVPITISYANYKNRIDSKTDKIKERYLIDSWRSDDALISPNYYNILRTIDKDEKFNPDILDESELNKFWKRCFDRGTFHAWISSQEMAKFWDDKYLHHIQDVIAIIE